MGKYDAGESEKKKTDMRDKEIVDEMRQLEDIRRLDETNPLEQAKKYHMIKSNPPEPGFMEVRCYKGEFDGEEVVIAESIQSDSIAKKTVENPFFVVDLNKCILGDISACPSSVGPMLLDMAQKLVDLEKGAFKIEKRKEAFNWWWIVFFILLIPGIITMILLFLR